MGAGCSRGRSRNSRQHRSLLDTSAPISPFLHPAPSPQVARGGFYDVDLTALQERVTGKSSLSTIAVDKLVQYFLDEMERKEEELKTATDSLSSLSRRKSLSTSAALDILSSNGEIVHFPPIESDTLAQMVVSRLLQFCRPSALLIRSLSSAFHIHLRVLHLNFGALPTRAASSPSLSPSLSLSLSPRRESLILSLLCTSLRGLEDLAFRNAYGLEENACSCLRELKDCRRLDLSGCTSLTGTSFATSLPLSLSTLNLSFCTSLSLSPLLSLLPTLTHLQVLLLKGLELLHDPTALLYALPASVHTLVLDRSGVQLNRGLSGSSVGRRGSGIIPRRRRRGASSSSMGSNNTGGGSASRPLQQRSVSEITATTTRSERAGSPQEIGVDVTGNNLRRGVSELSAFQPIPQSPMGRERERESGERESEGEPAGGGDGERSSGADGRPGERERERGKLRIRTLQLGYMKGVDVQSLLTPGLSPLCLEELVELDISKASIETLEFLLYTPNLRTLKCNACNISSGHWFVLNRLPEDSPSSAFINAPGAPSGSSGTGDVINSEEGDEDLLQLRTVREALREISCNNYGNSKNAVDEEGSARVRRSSIHIPPAPPSTPPLSHLLSLSLSQTRITDVALAFLEKLTYVPLTSLDLSRTRVTSLGVRRLSIAFRGTLELLSLDSCPNINDGAAPFIAEFRYLRHLNLSDTEISDDFLLQLRHHTGVPARERERERTPPGGREREREREIGLPHLSTLNLCYCNITNSGANLITKELFPALSSLNLDVHTVSDAGLCGVYTLRRLAKLDLFSARVSDRGMEGIARHLPQLISLELCGGGITDHGLSVSLPFLRRLQFLSLSRNLSLSDASLSHLSHLSALTHLTLSHTRLSTNALTSLIPQRVRFRLRHLNVYGCANVKVEKLLQQVQDRFPNLEHLGV